jgi:hypothetical protein
MSAARAVFQKSCPEHEGTRNASSGRRMRALPARPARIGVDLRWLLALVVLVMGLVTACSFVESETARNADLRQALRSDPAFQLIPRAVRGSLREAMPSSTGISFVDSQYGLNGFSGGELASPGVDFGGKLADWDTKLRAAGWTAAGGDCVHDDDPSQRMTGGIWTRQIKGRWAFFYVVAIGGDSKGVTIPGSRYVYGIYIRAVHDDISGNNVRDFSHFEPGPLGCAR